ncbi:MarR family winged helix-turn-helix transcriptional regulator [Arthrobacter sp. CJ23]|uniref:MarR family winged helix-turn-helix transcriptional regulator n=1 Tax=Arthrobacter sp. CJ23 TaxID=2972479 RepID=UPI00215D3E4E|nr:MarR family transcriptional regulator [Arthrobacter sp. CJ23]UVJ41316.1 MarR family transcriptional regulator [Arthrobacter sp. CJ23]
METQPSPNTQRQDLLEAVFASGRELSTAAVMFHTKLSELRGLSATEGKAIDILLRFGPMTAGEFGEHSGLAPASVTGLMQRLESKGVARRVRHEGDKRKVLIELVGDQVMAAMPHFVDFMGGMASLLEGYSDEELRVIADYSSKAARIQQEAAGRLGDASGRNANDDGGRAPSSNSA